MADSTVQPVKAPWHVWVVGVVSLLWNSVGVADFVMTQTRNRAYMSGFTPTQLDYYYSIPVWAVATWGVAVFAGVLGSLMLLFRKRHAIHLFLASTICMVLTDIHTFFLSDGMKVMGGAAALVFSSVIFVVGLLLLAYSRAMGRRGVVC
jgi:hypothetical protein